MKITEIWFTADHIYGRDEEGKEYRQSEFPSEFRNENQGPFYFLSIAIHNTLFVILQQR